MYFLWTVKKLWKIFKTLSSSSIFALSNHATSSQIQTGATVPLIEFYKKTASGKRLINGQTVSVIYRIFSISPKLNIAFLQAGEECIA